MYFAYLYFYIYNTRTYVPDAGRAQKLLLDPLKLELQMTVSHYVGVGVKNPTWTCQSQFLNKYF